jgi:hypothetical protein
VRRYAIDARLNAIVSRSCSSSNPSPSTPFHARQARDLIALLEDYGEVG